MKKTIIALILACFAAVLCAAPNLYVGHEKLKKITVIDTAVNEVTGEIPLKVSVSALKLDADDKFLYFTSRDTNALYRIRTKNLTVDSDYVSVGYGPCGIAVRNDGKAVYVINAKSNNVSIINPETMEAIGDPVQLPASPKAIIVTDDDRKAYIALSDTNGVALLDLATNKVTGVIPTGADPYSLSTFNNRLLFLSNEGMASVSVIDMRKNVMINEIVTTDMPRGLATYNNMLYVSVMNGIDIFELKGFTKPSSVGLDYPVYDCKFGQVPSGPRIFVAGYAEGAVSGKVAVINPGEGEIVSEIEVAGAPKYLETRRIRPTPVPVPTLVPTKIPPTPAPTAVPTPVPTLVPTKVPTPVPTDTPVPKKKKAKKKPTPVPTATPDMMLKSDLNGRVFMDNRPVEAGTKVKALSKHTDKVYTAFTDETGRYVFKQLPIGAYVVTVEATYIQEKAVAVTVNRGKNAVLEINTTKRQ
jgi:YVTN family beta-propeller protein